MESSQESSTASMEAAPEGSTTDMRQSGSTGSVERTTSASAESNGLARIRQHLALTIISFLAMPFTQKLTLYTEPVLMLVMALLYM